MAFNPGQSSAVLTPTRSAGRRLAKICFDANISERISNCDVRFYIIVGTGRGIASLAGFQTFGGGRNFPSGTIHRSFLKN
jgi:hypothetical protein